MNPHRYAWGIARTFPVAMIVGITTLLGFLLTKDRQPVPKERETFLLLLLWASFTITSFFAFYPEYAWPQWNKVSKIFLMTFVTVMLINSEEKLRYLLLTIALSIGLLGLKGGIFGLLTGGEWSVYGPDDTFLGDNNDMALALNMTIPLLVYMTKGEKNKNLKAFMSVLVAFTIFSTILTYSRGGLLTLGCVLTVVLLKAKRKILAIVGLFVIVVSVANFLPEQWFGRMSTIETEARGEHGDSAQGRINAWNMAFRLAQDRPFIGGGFETFKWEAFQKYAPEPNNIHDAHSIYFEILGEHGFITLLIFLLLVVSCFSSLRSIKKISQNNAEKAWANNYADMIQVSLVAYLIGGAFLGRAYFDLFYHLIAIVLILKILVMKKQHLQSNIV